MLVSRPASRKAVADRCAALPSLGDESDGSRGSVTQKRVGGFVGLVFMAAVIAAFISLSHAQAQTQAPNASQSAPRPAQIDRNGVLILIRESLLALDQANKTG